MILRKRESTRVTALALVFLMASSCAAFSSSSSSQRLRAVTTTPPTTPRLLALQQSDSNTNEGGNNEDDEISKLIGKRNQIKRKKSSSEGSSIEDKLMESIEPTVDLNLDKLPAFKTERPVRRASKQKDDNDQDDDENSSTSKAGVAPIIDYLAEYDDENDWHVPNRLAVTSSAWGDPRQNFVASSQKKLTKRMQQAGKFVAGDTVLGVTELLAGGVTCLETSPSYGDAPTTALDILQQCLEQQRQEGLPEPQLIVQLESGMAAKLKALVRPAKTMVASLEETLVRLGDESSVTLFLAPHVPYTPTRLVAAGLAAQIESGQAEYVGVSGISSPSTLKRLCRHLQARDATLTAAAFDGSLTNNRNMEQMIDACKLLNVVPLVTDPLDGGLASGVFTATNPSGGQAGVARGKFSFQQLEKLQPLHSVLETTAERVRTRVSRRGPEQQQRFKSKFAGPPPAAINTDITTTQVALQWVVAKGGVPVVPVNSPATAAVVLGCVGWTLEDDEVDQLDAAAALCKL